LVAVSLERAGDDFKVNNIKETMAKTVIRKDFIAEDL
jgi:hypothetical protein